MKLAAAVVAVSTLMWNGAALPQAAPNGGALVLPCVSSAETRELFVANKLVPPFRVMREAARMAQAEAIDIQLCRTPGLLVYRVTLLDRDGHILHRIISALNGAVVNGHGSP